MKDNLYRGKAKSPYEYDLFSQQWPDSCKDNFAYGSLIVYKDKYYICVSLYQECTNVVTTGCVNNGKVSIIEVIPETVGQYTGYEDKNGTKIFEGDYDIDDDGDYIVYVVDFRDGAFCLVSYSVQGMLMPYGFDDDAGGFGECDYSPMDDFNIEHLTIQGNIHNNPDVLKE